MIHEPLDVVGQRISLRNFKVFHNRRKPHRHSTSPINEGGGNRWHRVGNEERYKSSPVMTRLHTSCREL